MTGTSGSSEGGCHQLQDQAERLLTVPQDYRCGDSLQAGGLSTILWRHCYVGRSTIAAKTALCFAVTRSLTGAWLPIMSSLGQA